MTSNKKRILIVDDSTDDIRVVMENLKQDYAAVAATSGKKALEMAVIEPHPDVILLDVMMPDMDGYETCRRLKDNPETKGIDVIFISARDTTEEKLAGYEAGATDYLIKPVQPVVLMQKVKLAIKNKELRLEAEEQNSMAMQTAMTAISSIGEQGVVLDFMRRSFAINDIQDLADLVVETTANYMLDNSVQLRCSHELVHASSSGSISPLEQELLSRLADAGRIRESGSRLILNFGDISQLIKNMPDDEEKCGRLRDHLAILLEGAEARLKALEVEQQLAKLIEDSNQALQSIETMQKEQKETAMAIMDNVMIELEGAFLSYGLTEEQETKLMTVVQNGVEHSLDNLEKGRSIDEQLRKIIARLDEFSGE